MKTSRLLLRADENKSVKMLKDKLMVTNVCSSTHLTLRTSDCKIFDLKHENTLT